MKSSHLSATNLYKMTGKTVDDLIYKPRGMKRRAILRDLTEKNSLPSNKKKKKSPLKLFIDSSTLEYDLLVLPVEVDDGSTKPMYLKSVFEQVCRYDCNICVVTVFGRQALLNHHSSRLHYDRMQQQIHPHENFIGDKKTVIPKSTTQSYLYRCLKDLQSSFNIKRRQIVLVGTEYVVEVIERGVDCDIWTATCLLCERSVRDEICLMVEHLQSSQHLLTYLMLFFPSVFKKLKLLSKRHWSEYLNSTCLKIMDEFDWLQPKYHLGKLSLKEKKALRHSIDTESHINENMRKGNFNGTSLADDIPFNVEKMNWKVPSTIFSEFLVDSTKFEPNMFVKQQSKEWRNGSCDVQGFYVCKVCKIKISEGSSMEMIYHPCTGEHFINLAKGMKLYDKTPCRMKREFAMVSQPLIGLEYVVEYEAESGQVSGLIYCCMLCRKTMNAFDGAVTHLLSIKHKQRYIKHHMPDKDNPMRKLSTPEREQAITDLIKKCEAKFGRFEPWGTVYDINRKINSTTTLDDFILRKMIDGNHYGWDNDREQPTIIKGMKIPFAQFAGDNLPENENQSKRSLEIKMAESVQIEPLDENRKQEKSNKNETTTQTFKSQSSNMSNEKKKIHESTQFQLNSKPGTSKSITINSSSGSTSAAASQRGHGTESHGIKQPKESRPSTTIAHFSETHLDVKKYNETSKKKKRKESESSDAHRSRSRTKQKKHKRNSKKSKPSSKKKRSKSSSSNSSCSTTSDSLSPLARQRGLSPELPQEYRSPLESWAPTHTVVPQPGPETSIQAAVEDYICTDEERQAMRKLMKEELSKAAEDSYLTNYEEGSHKCRVYPDPEFRKGFEETWDHMCDVWFNEKRHVFGLTSKSHETEPERLRMLKRIMMETPISLTLCQPVCRRMVDTLLEAVNSHREMTYLVTDAQRLMLARGIVRNIQLHMVMIKSFMAQDPDAVLEAQKPPYCNLYVD